MLSEPPVLRYFDPKAKIKLQCDASEYGLEACIMANGQLASMHQERRCKLFWVQIDLKNMCMEDGLLWRLTTNHSFGYTRNVFCQCQNDCSGCCLERKSINMI